MLFQLVSEALYNPTTEEEEEILVLKMGVDYSCCTTGFFTRIGIVVFLVLFAGLMSGLTLGLMSMSLVEIEVLAKSGKPRDRKHAGVLLHPFFTFLSLSCEIFFVFFNACY